jgi:hypothetical protein
MVLGLVLCVIGGRPVSGDESYKDILRECRGPRPTRKQLRRQREYANSLTEEQMREKIKELPQKYQADVVETLERQGVPSAYDAYLRAWRKWSVALKSPDAPHPTISNGTSAELTELQKKVLEGLKDGFSVNKISREYQLSQSSVSAAKKALHKKGFALPFCTPPTSKEGKVVSVPQTHSFVVEVALPFSKGTNLNWRDGLNKGKVLNYRVSSVVSGVQEHFSLSERVSVRTTHNSVFLTVKDVWGDTVQDAANRAWELAAGAAIEIEGLYGLRFGNAIRMRFRGAEWALVEHEVARRCKLAGVKPELFVGGKRVMWVDDTPNKSLEFGEKRDAISSFVDESARVFRGLTNENLSEFSAQLWKGVMVLDERLLELAQLVGVVVKVQEQVLRERQKVLQEKARLSSEGVSKLSGRPGYIG